MFYEKILQDFEEIYQEALVQIKGCTNKCEKWNAIASELHEFFIDFLGQD